MPLTQAPAGKRGWRDSITSPIAEARITSPSATGGQYDFCSVIHTRIAGIDRDVAHGDAELALGRCRQAWNVAQFEVAVLGQALGAGHEVQGAVGGHGRLRRRGMRDLTPAAVDAVPARRGARRRGTAPIAQSSAPAATRSGCSSSSSRSACFIG